MKVSKVNFLLLSFFLVQGGFSTSLIDWLIQREDRLSIKDFLSYYRSNPSSLTFSWREKDTEWHSSTFQIKGNVLEASVPFFFVRLTPSIYKGGLLLSCKISLKQESNSPYELLLSAPFKPKSWERQFYPRLPYLILPPDSPATIRFLAIENDWTELQELGVYFYPFGVLENKTHFLLWGSIDIGKYALLTPNLLPNNIPAMCLRPLKLKMSDTLTLDLFIKSFPKAKFPRYRDVLRWYIENWKDSDPLTGAILGNAKAILEHKRKNPRRLPWGNLAGFPGGEPIADEEGNLNEWGEHLSKGWKAQKIGNCWYYAWHRWDETYPTEGEWIGEMGVKNSPEKIKGYIKALLSVGVHPFLYFRQLLAQEGLRDDGPPYKDWVAINEKGKVLWGYEWAPSAENAKLIGYEKLHLLPADFGNDSFRLWFLENLKRCIDLYQPAGIAFDMGWAYPNSAMFSRANPDTSNPHAVLRLQADVWNWLREKHPKKRIITNEAPGIPSQLFADGILIEGGFAAGKTELDYEAAKAIPTTVISYEYPSIYRGFIQALDKNQKRFLIVKYRAKGIEPSEDYAIYITEGVPGREATAIKLSELLADGEWHIAVVDLDTIPNVEKIKGLALQVQCADDYAYLDVAFIAFSSSPTPTSPSESPLNTFPSFLDNRFASFWLSHREWLQNPSQDFAVKRESDYIRFEVKGKGLGMKWEFLAYKGLIAQEYMKVLSLGACIGGDVWYPFPEILSFSAEAMAIPPITDSFRLEVKDKRIWASGWEDDEKLLIAVYNKSDETVSGSLRLKSDMVKKARRNKTILLNSYGEPILGGEVAIEESEIKFQIPPKGALLTLPHIGEEEF